MTLDPDQAIKAKIPLIFIVTRFYNLFVIDYRFPASLNDREFLVQQALARQFYHDMLLAREFELAPAEQYTQGNIGRFPAPLSRRGGSRRRQPARESLDQANTG